MVYLVISAGVTIYFYETDDDTYTKPEAWKFVVCFWAFAIIWICIEIEWYRHQYQVWRLKRIIRNKAKEIKSQMKEKGVDVEFYMD